MKRTRRVLEDLRERSYWKTKNKREKDDSFCLEGKNNIRGFLFDFILSMMSSSVRSDLKMFQTFIPKNVELPVHVGNGSHCDL